MLWIPKSAINVEGVQRALTFTFFEQQKTLLLTLWKESQHHLLVPREFWDPKTFDFPVIDCRPLSYQKVTIHSRIQLDHELENGQLRATGKTIQQDAMRALLTSRGGVLQLACGRGKTVIALDWAARRGFPTLIILDNTQLMKQWSEAIEQHLDVPGGVGLIQGDVFDWKKSLVLATYHTLGAKAATMPEEVRRWFGTIIWDEAHHIGAPTFARSADLFYGTRLGLTATPDREDGRHVIYNFHLGPVIFKNLTQDLRPSIYFRWTGFSLNLENPLVQAAAQDKNGELHIGKICAYLATVPARLDFILNEVRQALASGRKVLVLSKSVDSLVNLYARWNSQPQLLTDLPFPLAEEVEEKVPPAELLTKDLVRLQRKLHATIEALKKGKAHNQVQAKQDIALLEQRIQAHYVFKKCEALWNKRRAQYLKDLIAQPSNAGLMIHKVKPDVRSAMLKSKQVTFAIAKYGREGLDERGLDTVLVIEPLSSKNGLQQLLGRILRKKGGKQAPVAVFLEDDVGIFIGMCQKLRRHLRDWPTDEGGPFDYENLGHPITNKSKRGRTPWNGPTRTPIRAPGY